MSEEDKSVAPRNVKHVLSCDDRDVNKVSTYAAKKKNELQNVSKKFTDIGYFGKIWDSKVPEVDKKFYHFFTLTQTNCANVLEEVKKYQAFYEELTDALHKIRTVKETNTKESSDVSNEQNSEVHKTSNEEESNNNLHELSHEKIPSDSLSIESNEEEPSGASCDVKNEEDGIENEIIEPYEIILEMNEKLSKMTEEARLGKEFTGSSAVYKLHKSFIEKHRKLENMIKRVECVALKQGLKKAIDGWKESKQSLKKLEADLSSTNEKCDQMNNKLDQVIEDNRILRQIMKRYFEGDNKKPPDSTSENSAENESDD